MRLMPPAFAAALALALALPAPLAAQSKNYRLPSVDLKQGLIWGAACDGPDGGGLSFGGQDQDSDEGASLTRIKVNGQWVSISDDLWREHPLQPAHRLLMDLAAEARGEMVVLRAGWLAGKVTAEADDPNLAAARMRWQKTITAIADATQGHLEAHGDAWPDDDKAQLSRAIARLRELAAGTLPAHQPAAPKDLAPVPALIAQMHRIQMALEQSAQWLAPQPGPRALSPIVYDSKTNQYILFGGDHLDYLTNDTWLFDPAARRWSLRRPAAAPPARANHQLKANGDGTITLSGGYTYASNTDYMGGQYRDHGDGEWTYDIAKDAWTSSDNRKGAPPDARVYRTGAFHTDFFLQAAEPDVAAHDKKLRDLPVNTWVAMNPPKLPQMNRDWGSAVIDPDRDLILRFCGGHSAHGGSDVLHYHLASNRWELPFPVELPLGQTYVNTEYPRGFNFNRRPWVTGHTYQSYGYDPDTKSMLFTGERNFTYVWDPDRADWTGRFAKPKGMAYGSCYYTLTLTTTKHGLVCWTQEGKLFQFDYDHRQWNEITLTGELPGSVVDNSTMVYDSKRDRLLFFRKPYGDKVTYDGVIHAVDWPTRKVTMLKVANAEAAAAISYLCQIRYDEEHDVLLAGCTLAPDAEGGLRRTPVYNCATDQWQSWRITGDDPSGKRGRNVSLGLMYDRKRKLFWAVDAASQVFVLRLAPQQADAQPMR